MTILTYRMYVGIEIIVNDVTGRRNKRYKYLCDQCKINLTLSGRFNQSDSLSFCGEECRNFAFKHGVVKSKLEATFQRNYGCKNPYASKVVIDKKKQTCLAKTGFDNPSKDPSVKKKKEETFLKNYGARNNFGRVEVREIAQSSLTEKFGGPSPACDSEFVERVMRSHEYNAKRFRSWVKNGTIKQSNPENLLINELSNLYGNVDRHITVNGWSIDAFITKLNVYVQLDGIHWHGTKYGRENLVERSNAGSKQFKQILGKFDRDREQDLWFPKNDLKFIRFFDDEVMTAFKAKTLNDLIKERMNIWVS